MCALFGFVLSGRASHFRSTRSALENNLSHYFHRLRHCSSYYFTISTRLKRAFFPVCYYCFVFGYSSLIFARCVCVFFLVEALPIWEYSVEKAKNASAFCCFVRNAHCILIHWNSLSIARPQKVANKWDIARKRASKRSKSVLVVFFTLFYIGFVQAHWKFMFVIYFPWLSHSIKINSK